MKLYVFADESGVFDRVHADLFVYGGVIILGKTNYDYIVNKHLSLERRLRREDASLKNAPEIKAAYLNLKQRETVDEEFRRGTYSPNYDKFFPPLFSLDFPRIPVAYCDSKKVVGVRIADITANWVYKAYSDCSNDQQLLQTLLKSTVVLHLP